MKPNTPNCVPVPCNSLVRIPASCESRNLSCFGLPSEPEKPSPPRVSRLPIGAKESQPNVRRCSSKDRSRSKTWLQWKQTMLKNGMWTAAQAISHQLCKHCDQQDRLERRMNRSTVNGMNMVDDAAFYDPRELTAFTNRMAALRKAQFGRWPRVYEKMPELKQRTWRRSIRMDDLKIECE